MVQSQPETTTYDSRTISWWSWQPGIMPRNALLIGGSFSLVALLFISLGGAVHIVTFAVNQETYQTVEEGTVVTIIYTPHLHYVYSLKLVGEKSA
ncbi:MAG: hypothetical protein ACYDER_09230 [Ktedonobacteraceae bacterium]